MAAAKAGEGRNDEISAEMTQVASTSSTLRPNSKTRIPNTIPSLTPYISSLNFKPPKLKS